MLGIKNIFRRKQEFLEWDDYQSKIEFLSGFNFQQDTRKQNIRNSDVL